MTKEKQATYVRLQSSTVFPDEIGGEDVQTYVGAIRVGDLISRYQIPYWEQDSKTGYQRELGMRRVNKLAAALKDRKVGLPTALLLSVRDPNYQPKIDKTGLYLLQLPPEGEQIFYVVDGQHRLRALEKLVEEDAESKWRESRVSVVVFFGKDENAEMNQFHIVNSNAMNVPTDLAMSLLAERAGRSLDFMNELIASNRDWQVHAQRLTEQVTRQGVWFDLIRFPGQSRADKPNTVIRSSSFVNSLKDVYTKDELFRDMNPKERVDTIIAYWSGIQKVLPDCFQYPKRYNLQKTVGVNVLHSLLPAVMIRVRINRNNLNSADAYSYVLADALLELSGKNDFEEEVVGADFWLTGRRGVAGAYSSGAGRKTLVDIIRRKLPKA